MQEVWKLIYIHLNICIKHDLEAHNSKKIPTQPLPPPWTSTVKGGGGAGGCMCVQLLARPLWNASETQHGKVAALRVPPTPYPANQPTINELGKWLRNSKLRFCVEFRHGSTSGEGCSYETIASLVIINFWAWLWHGMSANFQWGVGLVRWETD